MDSAAPTTPGSAQHQPVLQAAPAIVHLAPDGRVIDANETTCRWLGYSRDELLGLTIFDINPQATLGVWREHWRQLREHKSLAYHSEHRRKDGSTFPVELTTSHLKFGDQEFALSVVQDVSERRRTQNELEAALHRFNDAQQVANIGSWEWDVATDEVFWSDQMYRICGYEPSSEPLNFDRAMSLLRTDDIDGLIAILHRARDHGERADLEFPVFQGDGTARHCYGRARPIFGADGRLIKLFGTVQDITERHRVRRELETTVQRLNDAQRVAHIGSWEENLRTGRLWWSDESYRLFGWEPGAVDLTMDKIIEIVHPDDRDAMWHHHHIAMEREYRFEAEHRIVLPDGSTRYLHVHGQSVHDDNGPVLIYGTSQDVTERHRAQRELSRMAERLQTAQSVARIGSWEHDLKRDVLFWSDEMYRIFGYKPGEVEPSIDRVSSLIHPGDRDDVGTQVRRAFEEGAPLNLEHRIVLSGGAVRYCRVRGLILRDPGGEPTMLYGTTQDITEQKLAEMALRRSEEHYRMADQANRRLLAEVNHRVRNNLTGLLSLLRMTRTGSRDVGEFTDLLRQRITAMTRAHNLLAGAQWQRLDLHAIFRAVAAGYGPAGDGAPRVNIDGPPTWITPRQVVPLALALNELFINAAKHGCHSNDRGRLDITWRHEDDQLIIEWREFDGPPIEGEVASSLGTELVHGFIGFELNGQIEMAYPRDGAAHTLRVPIDRSDPSLHNIP